MSPAGPRDATAFEMREALQQTGCPVCALTVRSVARLMKSIAYEQVNDLDLRRALRSAGGFCNAHAHQWLRGAYSTLGTALIYRDVLQASLRELNTSPRRGMRERLRGRPLTEACPACDAQREAEQRYMDALLALASADDELPDMGGALCRRHALGVLRAGGDASAALLQRTRALVEELVAELDEVIRKEDYRFRHEPRTEGERTAPARAIVWAAGLDGLVDEK